MKVVFAGPSLPAPYPKHPDIEYRGPAETGDIEAAVEEGAHAIGLIDGHYQQVGSVWHKEILHALSKEVTVFGGASMGALRAAECHAFGMVPVGVIASRYCQGILFDDADVAVINAPAELGFAALSEAAVDADATLRRLHELGLVDDVELQRLLSASRRLFFADRTDETIVEQAHLNARATDVLTAYRRHHVSLKRRDARKVVRAVAEFAPGERTIRSDLVLSNSAFWQHRPSRHRLLP